MGFLESEVIPIKPRLVFGSNGEKEYFAVSFEGNLLGSMVHLHIRWVGEREKPLNQRPVHTYLLADTPDWAREVVSGRVSKTPQRKIQRRKV